MKKHIITLALAAIYMVSLSAFIILNAHSASETKPNTYNKNCVHTQKHIMTRE